MVFSVLIFIAFIALQGCYTVSQGYHQAKLLLTSESIEQILAEKSETPERLERLKWVPQILEYAREKVGLETGSSYTRYIRLDGEAVTWVVQAAEKRKLQRKTWWFPLVGSQPYLGFFAKKDALTLQEQLKREGYDTRVGGVSAFSLLGYLPDPLYSSMIDSQSLADIVDVIIHECTHRTLYLPNASTFNESFADFVAKKATVQFLNELGNSNALDSAGTEIAAYTERYQAELRAGPLFKSFLANVMKRLEEFYAAAENDLTLQDEAAFLAARTAKFKEIELDFDREVRGAAKGSWYEHAFKADRLNNAVVLAYSLYEAKAEPFEQAYLHAGQDLAKLINNLKICLADDKDLDEELLWKSVSQCKSGE